MHATVRIVVGRGRDSNEENGGCTRIPRDIEQYCSMRGRWVILCPTTESILKVRESPRLTNQQLLHYFCRSSCVNNAFLFFVKAARWRFGNNHTKFVRRLSTYSITHLARHSRTSIPLRFELCMRSCEGFHMTHGKFYIVGLKKLQ